MIVHRRGCRCYRIGTVSAARSDCSAVCAGTGTGLALLYAFCGPLAILFYFNGAIFVSMALFNNLGHPYYSTWINWGRHTIGTIPFLYLGGMWFGPVGVLAGPYVGGVIFGLLGLALARRVMEQSQDSESEVQTHQAHQLRLFHLRR